MSVYDNALDCRPQLVMQQRGRCQHCAVGMDARGGSYIPSTRRRGPDSRRHTRIYSTNPFPRWRCRSAIYEGRANVAHTRRVSISIRLSKLFFQYSTVAESRSSIIRSSRHSLGHPPAPARCPQQATRSSHSSGAAP